MDLQDQMSRSTTNLNNEEMEPVDINAGPDANPKEFENWNDNSVSVVPRQHIPRHKNLFKCCGPKPSLTPKMWRSTSMARTRVYMESESAFTILMALGSQDAVQFIDLNEGTLFSDRTFVDEVKHLEELERKMRLLRSSIEMRNMPVPREKRKEETMSAGELDAFLEEQLQLFGEQSSSVDGFDRSREELEELMATIDFNVQLYGDMQALGGGGGGGEGGEEMEMVQVGGGNDESPEDVPGRGGVPAGSITGIGDLSQMLAFERVLWRTTRGNSVLSREKVDEDKFVFAVFYSAQTVETKIRKLCDAFNIRVFALPPMAGLPALKNEILERLSEIEVVASRSEKQLIESMEKLSLRMYDLEMRVLHDKSVYHEMNKFQFDGGRKILVGEFWSAREKVPEIEHLVRMTEARYQVSIQTVFNDTYGEEAIEGKAVQVPPTLMHTNKFSKTFNSIVEAYAVAAYGEVNPAVFTMVTFPFLFAVMFGDVGHGMLLVIASLAILVFEKKFDRMSKAELGQFGLVYRARYMVLLMSFASMYVGFIYNEFFSIPMNLQYSTWSETNTSLYAVKNTNATFPFGVDPAWKVSENELLFYNSLKMKMSIIIAYFHMMLGIIMHAFNAVYFSRPYDLFFEFIPRVVFLTSIIGYMVLLIFWKWIVVWEDVNPNCSTCLGNGASAAPYIISIMVDMFLKILDPSKLCQPGEIDTPCADNSTCVYEYMLGCPTQGYVELILIILAVASIPVMLLVKPLLMRRDAKKAGNEEFEFGEVFVHQVIETIEFVLGAISNTASYLRLWALSLAHSELSIVFWEKILVTGMHEAANSASIGWILMFGTWAIWGFFTLGVILGMEGLSAFLHTLRLHWVEFQNKFYNVVGTGLKFKPFSFRKIEELYIDEITGGV